MTDETLTPSSMMATKEFTQDLESGLTFTLVVVLKDQQPGRRILYHFGPIVLGLHDEELKLWIEDNGVEVDGPGFPTAPLIGRCAMIFAQVQRVSDGECLLRLAVDQEELKSSTVGVEIEKSLTAESAVGAGPRSAHFLMKSLALFSRMVTRVERAQIWGHAQSNFMKQTNAVEFRPDDSPRLRENAPG